MTEASALKVAIDLVHVPSRARIVRAAPLPHDTLVLLRIAADDDGALDEGMELTGRSREIVKTAAAFFIEQVLLSPQSDSYRVLGANETATNSELRRNMALLLKALHPDLDQNKDRCVFAGRVTGAWEDLKTLERRDAYDQALKERVSEQAGRSGRTPGRSARSQLRAKQGHLNGARPSAQFLVRRGRVDNGAAPPGFLRRTLRYFFGSNKS